MEDWQGRWRRSSPLWRWLGLPVRTSLVLMAVPFSLLRYPIMRCVAPYEAPALFPVEEALDFIWYGIW